MIRKLLLSDLERHYQLEGHPGRKATLGRLVLHAGNPRFLPVVLCRMAYALHRRKLGVLGRLFSMFNFVFFGIEISMSCEIGPGLYLPHTSGTVIGARSIGSNVIIYNGVTLGTKELDVVYHPEWRPIIGDNVVLGAGAKVLGRIKIGKNTVVCANSLVLRSFSGNVIVGGIPASILRRLAKDPDSMVTTK